MSCCPIYWQSQSEQVTFPPSFPICLSAKIVTSAVLLCGRGHVQISTWSLPYESSSQALDGSPTVRFQRNGIVLKSGHCTMYYTNTYCGSTTGQGTVLGSLYRKAILPNSEFSAPIKIIIKYILKRGLLMVSNISQPLSNGVGDFWAAVFNPNLWQVSSFLSFFLGVESSGVLTTDHQGVPSTS